MFLQRNLLLWAQLAALALICGITPTGFSQAPAPASLQTPCNSTTFMYSREKIMDAIRHPQNYTKLTLVASHRGYWETYPENSMNAILAAGYCYEIVEADIKPALDGRPVVEHDLVLNRTTTLTGNLANTSVASFRAAFLRDRHGVVTDMHPMSAQDLIDAYASVIGSNTAGFVLALDVKGPDAKADPWPLIMKFHEKLMATDPSGNLAKSVIYKIEASALPGLGAVEEFYKNTGKTLNLYIVYNKKEEEQQSLEYEGYVWNIGSEVNYPYRGSPTQALLQYLKRVGTFSTYYDLAEGVGTSKALCCGTLDTNTSSGSRANHLDYRGRYDWYAQTKSDGHRQFTLFTTDRPDVLEGVLKGLGYRETNKIAK